jgi:cysteine desulfuration protein SufE
VTLAEKQQQLTDDLAIIEDPQERLGAVIDRAKRLPPFSAAERSAENRVPGCVSQVWLVGELRGGHCEFRSDAEGPLVRGLVAFLCEYYKGGMPAEVAASIGDPLESLGLIRNLSPTRRIGFAAVRTRIREQAKTWI